MEEFETQREFNEKFPSRMYICSRCNGITTDPYTCTNCGSQKNNFLYVEKTYKYAIKETGKKDHIFKPLELEKGD